jgi:glucokinase
VILAGDIGGTKTRLAVFEETSAGFRPRSETVYPSGEYASLEEIVTRFLSQGPGTSIRAACFGVAGPVFEGKAQATNLPWSLEEGSLARASRAARVKLLNDLEAAAYGMLVLPPEDRAILNPGSSPRRKGNIAVIAAGTGLGEAMLIWDGRRHQPVASEGGHGDFAPRSEQEIGLLRFLQAEFERVSYERVLSGPGFHNIYRFLRTTSSSSEPGWLSAQIAQGDPSAAISQAGLEEKDPVCMQTLELFASLYGAEAGNLALRCLSVGGVFVGGGIAPKILPILQRGGFMRAFMAKGRFSKLVASMEVSVALNSRAPLLGAAHYAREL